MFSGRRVFFVVFALAVLGAAAVFGTGHEAMFYQKMDKGVVQCALCPHRCVIVPGRRGFCGVRENQGGTLVSLVYAKPCSLAVDPIEKKPLDHFFPGSKTLSLATVGCNLKCKFCQNWQISQATPEEVTPMDLAPEEVVRLAREKGLDIIAYTYTEPTIYYEYMFDIARLAKKAGLKNVMHSAGYINEEPLRQLAPYLDAANIDLKGFDPRFYTGMTLGKLDDVLRSLKILKEAGVWLEITNLLIPGVNDSDEEVRKMAVWIRENLGPDVPLHFSRFWPLHQLVHISPTPVASLERARRIALEAGLHYVYIGNVGGHEAENTFCPSCGRKVVGRRGYVVTEVHVVKGRCEFCKAAIAGVWS